MCKAIAAAHSIDEVKNIRDKMVAMEAYARQAKNKEAEVLAREIRERAEREWGLRYSSADKATGARQPGTNRGTTRYPHATASLKELGVSKTQAANWQAKAAIPQAEFERAIKTGRLNVLIKKERRSDRETKLAEATQEASRRVGHTLYGVIYADPPWRFEPYSRESGMDRAADNHYPTMELADICAIVPPAADHCALFLWATVPMLPQALQVMAAWRFTYRTHFVWVKQNAGTGYWNRNIHELLLLGTRGNVPAPAPGEQFLSVIEAPLGEHSAKPEAFAEMIEEMFPHATLLEMFARGPRLGWDVWGNEARAPV
jgi:N6-adenosine-specific RNA methylase IME4